MIAPELFAVVLVTAGCVGATLSELELVVEASGATSRVSFGVRL